MITKEVIKKFTKEKLEQELNRVEQKCSGECDLLYLEFLYAEIDNRGYEIVEERRIKLI